ncbi:MAG: hypothetical protein ACUVRM_07595 [Bacillota bacterium]
MADFQKSLVAYLQGTGDRSNKEKSLSGKREPGSPVTAALWRLAGCCETPAPADLGENHDRYLAEIWERKKDK